MDDAGNPISYEVLEPGTPVLERHGREIGTVSRVLAFPEEDIFDGIIIQTPAGDRFVDAEGVTSIHERAVQLSLDFDEARALPEPSPNPGVLSVDPADTAKPTAGDRARRVWNIISGNY